MSDEPEAVEAVRIGPGQFLLAAERVAIGLVFVADGERFAVIGAPVNVGSGRYLATTRLESGPRAGSQLTAQLTVGRRVR